MQEEAILNPRLLKTFNRVLLVVPHPDDETYYAAGLIQKLIKLKKVIKVIVLTKGEESTLKFGLDHSHDLATVREKEFQKVCSLLNIRLNTISDFNDGFLEAHKDEIRGYLISGINNFTPDVVVAFEPAGVYGRPDHITLTEVIENINSILKFRLMYLTVGSTYNPSEDALSMAKDPTKVNPLKPNLTIKLTLDESLKKLMAIRIYKSQFKFDYAFFIKLLKRELLFKEFFFLKV